MVWINVRISLMMWSGHPSHFKGELSGLLENDAKTKAKALRWEQSLLCSNKKEKAHVSSIVNMALGIMR